MRSKNLFQSSEWAKLQELSGHRSVALGHGEFFAFVHPVPVFKQYLYIPRGSLKGIRNQESARLPDGQGMKARFLGLVHTEEVSWIRVEPEDEQELQDLQRVFPGCVHLSPHEMQPRESLVVDITRASEELLARMKPKTRYNIRLAEKHGVRVRFSREPRDIDAFLSLIRATTKRKGIAPHPDEYYRNFFEAFGEDGCVLALAEHEGNVLAANLLVFWGDTAYYLHGGSSEAQRELMVPFLLHFATMEEAKRHGCHTYDFGGVATQSKVKSQKSKVKDWAGITRFKTGFAPDTPTTVFPGTYDIVFSPMKYQCYLLLRVLSEQSRSVKNCLTRRTL